MGVFEVTDGIWGIDVEMFDEQVLSVYLVRGADRLVLIDTGTANGVEALTDGLAELGYSLGDIDVALLSHIHVDHSGGTSALVEANPDLEVYIHESTQDHLVDPSRLIESSKRALGVSFPAMGEQGSVPTDNVAPIPEDGMTLDLGTRTLDVRPRPGHSPDHVIVWCPEDEILFANETIGYHFPRTETWLPPATIPNFDVDRTRENIDIVESLDPERVLLAHYGEAPRPLARTYDRARERLDYYEDRILGIYDDLGDVAETEREVRSDVLSFTPEYDPAVEQCYARLLTHGYLLYHDRM